MQMGFFSKQLTCFYCGYRSAQTDRDPVRKWRCKHCDAVNYLDENGQITDPPVSDTNPDVYGPGASSPPFESVDFKGAGLFCSDCIRNQHMFTTMLASYYPPPDDPAYRDYELYYPEYRRTLEQRYPLVCANCEPQVRERIRQTGYEAKTDHLRRMMERTRAERVAGRTRRQNWRSWLVFLGAIAYWVSIVGQIAWDIMGALNISGPEPLQDPDASLPVASVLPCIFHTLRTRCVPSHCSADFAPLAGLSLLAGFLSLWWNPQLQPKVEGRHGRLIGLGDYYKVQLIVLVVRGIFWGVLRDPSSSGLQENLPAALHLFMIILTCLSVVISQRIIKLDKRPLVSWSEVTPTITPTRTTEARPSSATGGNFSTAVDDGVTKPIPRFPLEKLASPPEPVREVRIPTPPAEVDGMDWTPSVQQEIRPTVSVYQRNERSVLDGPMPFYGSLPPAPQPPSWQLRNQPSQKPIEQVIEPNPFHRTPTQSPPSWHRSPDSREPVFAPPKFFPPTDHEASTGLESLFDQTFTIRSPEERGKQDLGQKPKQTFRRPTDVQEYLLVQYIRLGLLLTSLAAWALSQGGYLSVPGNYIEVISLGSASLIAGFGLLEVLKQPMVHWNGMEIMVYIAELAIPVHLGYNLPSASFAREYFDRYGKLLLIFMAAQEALGLLFFYRTASANASHQVQQTAQQPPQPEPPKHDTSGELTRPKSSSLSESQPSLPALSFSSTAPGSSFATQPSEPRYKLGFPPNQGFNQGFNKNHSFSLESLKSADAGNSDYDGDSDTETTMTTATTATNNTVRNIRYGRNPNMRNPSKDSLFSPSKTDLGPGIGGLSLDDRPGRMTRSQTQQLQSNGGYKYPARRTR